MNHRRQCSAFTLALLVSLCLIHSAPAAQRNEVQSPARQATPSAAPKQPSATKSPSETEDLQQAIDRAGNDRAALVRNLEDFLKQYPESRQRPQIYRALVEASLQLRDSPRAADYAERIVALAPEDISMTLLAIQLLERTGDEAALRRALNYSTRVLDFIDRTSTGEKSPKISKEEWEAEQKRDKVNILSLRGRLDFKLHDNAAAEKDFRASMTLSPNAAAGEKLGEIAELNKGRHQGICSSLCAGRFFRRWSQSPRDSPKTRQRLAPRPRFRPGPRRLSFARLRRRCCILRCAEAEKKRQRQRTL
jgi:tetratricopeptide (TPR) repeat protein